MSQINRVIGFMRNSRIPFKLTRLLAKACKYYDIDVVYFTPKDVDIEHEIIHAKFLIQNKWVEREITVPPFIDCSPYSFKYKEVIRFLEKRSILSSYKLGSKDHVYKKILKDGEFAYLVIPTADYSSFYDFYHFLQKHEHIVIKPKNGLRGNSVYSLAMKENNYTLSYQQTESILSFEQLETFFDETLLNKNYLLQKYIASVTNTGDPFDCRIRLEKNGKGKWAVPLYLVRIGTNQKVVSNVAQGGSVTTLKPFLEANYPDSSDEMVEKLKNIAKTLPYKVEELFHKNLTSMGIDIGIDKYSKELFLFEIETGPGFEFAIGELALVKSEYYKYVINKLDNR